MFFCCWFGNLCLGHDGSYNKMLAWVDVVMEFIVERLYFLLPTLPDVLGGLAPNLQVSDESSALAVHGFWQVVFYLTSRRGRYAVQERDIYVDRLPRSKQLD